MVLLEKGLLLAASLFPHLTRSIGVLVPALLRLRRVTALYLPTHFPFDTHIPLGQALIVPFPPGLRRSAGTMQCLPSKVVSGGQFGFIIDGA